MKLTSIEIKSFRSLVNQRLDLTHSCMVLVGLNESGKSNLLTAMRTLDNDYKLKPTDYSKVSGESPRIRFDINFEENEHQELLATLESWFEVNTQTLPSDILKKNKLLVENVSKVRTINSDGKIQYFLSYDLVLDVIPGFSIAKDIAGKEDILVQIDASQVPLKECVILRDSTLEANTAIEALFVPLTKEELIKALRPKVSIFITRKTPAVIYWEYEPKYLIPSETKYEDFIKGNDPREHSVPLYNIFMLAHALKLNSDDDLIEKVQQWQSDASLRRKDTDIVNEAVNKYVKSIWQDYNQEIHVGLEESKITVHIKDPESPNKNYYEMIERSQGFKTFVSFILTTSADAQADVENFILVLDEPETHLHPSGVRFMKNELLKLAGQGNQVLYATHSVFMIDRQELSRHVIVKKDHESTRLSPVKRNNITQESLIYEALGTRTDEFSIQLKNLMFEGEMDRNLFGFFITHCLRKKEKNHAEEYELLDGGGTNAIIKFFKDKTLPPESRWVLVLDNDKPAEQLQANLKQVSGFNAEKQTEIVKYSLVKNHELEDILPLELVSQAFNDAISGVFSGRLVKAEFVDTRAISDQISELKARATLSEDEGKQLEETFKNLLSCILDARLGEIGSKKTVADKQLAFKNLFPEYHNFALKLLAALK